MTTDDEQEVVIAFEAKVTRAMEQIRDFRGEGFNGKLNFDYLDPWVAKAIQRIPAYIRKEAERRLAGRGGGGHS